MPSPVGHTLAGCCLAAALRAPALRRPAFVAALLIAGNLPDVDFLPPLLGLSAANVHQQATHSIAFALAAALALGAAFRGAAPLLQAWRWIAAALLAHLALDLFNHDGLAPIGIPLGWPLTDERWLSPVTLFPGIDRSQVLGARNLRELAAELLWLAPPLAWLSRRLASTPIARSGDESS